jgi:hypothetical protein
VLHSVSCHASLDWALDDDSDDNVDEDDDPHSCKSVDSDIDKDMEEIRMKVGHRLSIADSPQTKPKGVATAVDSSDSSDWSDTSPSSSNSARYQPTTRKKEETMTMLSPDPQPALKMRRFQHLPSFSSSSDSDEELGDAATKRSHVSVVIIDSSSEDERLSFGNNNSEPEKQARDVPKRSSRCDETVDLCSP